MVDFMDSIRGEMPFLDHLEELRGRLFKCAAAIFVGILVAFGLFTQFDIFEFLARPVTRYLQGNKLIYTNPGGAFSITMQAALTVGLLLASPVVIYQIWRFVSPAMYRREKRLVVPIILSALLLFVIGFLLGYFWVLPITLRFLFGFSPTALQPMISGPEYFSFALMLCASFGAVFETPIVILILSFLGVVSARALGNFRRFAAVVAVIVGAFIAVDIMGMMLIAVLFYVLYEISIGLAFFVERGKIKKKLREEAEEQAEFLVDDAPKRLGEV